MHQKHVQREANGRRKDGDKNLGEILGTRLEIVYMV